MGLVGYGLVKINDGTPQYQVRGRRCLRALCGSFTSEPVGTQQTQPPRCTQCDEERQL